MGNAYHIDGSVGIVLIQNSLDITSIGAFKKQFKDMIDRGIRDYILDFSAADFIDSSAVGAIVLMFNAMQKKGRIVLVNSQTNLLKVFVVAGLKSVFPIFSSRDEARAYLNTPR